MGKLLFWIRSLFANAVVEGFSMGLKQVFDQLHDVAPDAEKQSDSLVQLKSTFASVPRLGYFQPVEPQNSLPPASKAEADKAEPKRRGRKPGSKNSRKSSAKATA